MLTKQVTNSLKIKQAPRVRLTHQWRYLISLVTLFPVLEESLINRGTLEKGWARAMESWGLAMVWLLSIPQLSMLHSSQRWPRHIGTPRDRCRRKISSFGARTLRGPAKHPEHRRVWCPGLPLPGASTCRIWGNQWRSRAQACQTWSRAWLAGTNSRSIQVQLSATKPNSWEAAVVGFLEPDSKGLKDLGDTSSFQVITQIIKIKLFRRYNLIYIFYFMY